MVKIPSLKEAKNNINTFCKRVLFLSSKKPGAGMALEGSLALPIFLFFMMTVLLGLEAVRFQSNVQEALHQAGNRRACSEYQVRYLDGERADAFGPLYEYLGSQFYSYVLVAGGDGGLAFNVASGEG